MKTLPGAEEAASEPPMKRVSSTAAKCEVLNASFSITPLPVPRLETIRNRNNDSDPQAHKRREVVWLGEEIRVQRRIRRRRRKEEQRMKNTDKEAEQNDTGIGQRRDIDRSIFPEYAP